VPCSVRSDEFDTDEFDTDEFDTDEFDTDEFDTDEGVDADKRGAESSKPCSS